MDARAQQRTAAASIAAAAVLVALKLGTGIATGSLGLISAGVESAGDLVAAVMTFVAVRFAARPADSNHPFGHRRAENLSGLGEAVILSVGGTLVTISAVGRLLGGSSDFEARWFVFVVIVVAMAIDAFRIVVSVRTARLAGSAALRANAFHFAGDFAGSAAVLIGFGLVAAGWHAGDAAAALVVAVIIFAAAGRLIAENAQVLMDRTPEEERVAAVAAIDDQVSDVELRRLRLRESAGRYFADVTVGVQPAAAVVEGHATADRVESAVRSALPEADVVVHIEPRAGADVELRQRVLATALAEPLVLEVHDIGIFTGDEHPTVSLHLKFAEETPLAVAHEVADRIEQELTHSEHLAAVRTHLEPLERPLRKQPVDTEALRARESEIAETVLRCTERRPRGLDLIPTAAGPVLLLTIATSDRTLPGAHARASELEERLRVQFPDLVEVVVHTEPA